MRGLIVPRIEPYDGTPSLGAWANASMYSTWLFGETLIASYSFNVDLLDRTELKERRSHKQHTAAHVTSDPQR